MKNLRNLLATLLIVLSSASLCLALDLSSFQDFLRVRRPDPKPATTRVFTDLSPGSASRQATSYRELRTDADASFKTNEVRTLNPVKTRQTAGFGLPLNTRVPEALRPLRTERKYPRQGISLTGMSGGILVPSPGVLEPGKSAFGIHAIPFDLFNISDVKYRDSNYFDTSVKMTWGVMEGVEIGFDKTFANQDRFDLNEPLYINGKYQIPGNVTLGASIATSAGSGYHSAWVGAGVPAAWAAVGVNFGGDDYKFSYTGWDKLRRAKFGKYNYTYNTAVGYAAPVFFMLGGAIGITRSSQFVYDFNGDKFSLGIRLNYQRTLYLDFAWMSDGDYERLPGAIAQKRKGNFVFGGSFVY